MQNAENRWQERVEAYRTEHPQDWRVVIGLEAAGCERYKAICMELQEFGLYELLAVVTCRLDSLLYESQANSVGPSKTGTMGRVFEDDDPTFDAVEKQRIVRISQPCGLCLDNDK